MRPSALATRMINMAVESNGVQVSGELGAGPVALPRQPQAHKSLLGTVGSLLAVRTEAVNERLKPGAVPLDQKIKSPHVDFYRGKGLWIGIVLKEEADGARRFCEALKEKGLLCKETHWNVIRLAPPLVITKEEIDWALERVEEVLTTL